MADIATGIHGLSHDEVRERLERGLVNVQPEQPSRSVTEILRANVFTRFNAILGTLLAVILVVGPFQDALFGIVLVTNALIGIVQELRAKRTLDRLALLNAPRARVLRAGEVVVVAVEQVVMDDVLCVEPGDQLVVDGKVLTTAGLEVDESLLSGESEPVAKAVGDEVLSGSFVTAGSGRFRATRIGGEAYARRITSEARRFSLVRSELRRGIDTILRVVTWIMIPMAVLLVSSQLVTDTGLADAIRGSVAGVGAMIPEGLVLLTSVAFAAGVIRLGRRGVLVQELAAIEGLARVDVICLDKTGTITEAELALTSVEELGSAPTEGVLASIAAADEAPNASMRAVAAAYPVGAGWTVRRSVPFSSARKWSAVDAGDAGTWVMGAPDVLLDGSSSPVRARVEELADEGRRVLLVARAGGELDGETLPRPLEPALLVTLEERVRPDAADTLAFFRVQGVAVKVISGDHPRTVGAVAGRVGVEGADDPVDARELPEDLDQLADVLESRSVFGRVTPHQKRAMVAALQSRGHVVAMTGDGVNDALALKDADLGVAMGSGSEAARAVARIVLLENTFDVLPHVVAEGRRVIGNVERVANLFVTKTVYAVLLAFAVGVARFPFPFYPRHLTIVSSLTIGIPAFFLALAPNAQRARPGFVSRVIRFAAPAGFVAASATFGAYALAHAQPNVGLDEARTTATIVLFIVAMWVLGILARPLTVPRHVLVSSMVAIFVLVMAVPAFRSFFALDIPPLVVLLAAIGVAAVADIALELGWRVAARLQVWLDQRAQI